jgi:hypothetical protein
MLEIRKSSPLPLAGEGKSKNCEKLFVFSLIKTILQETIILDF